jgi:hypothetical protein
MYKIYIPGLLLTLQSVFLCAQNNNTDSEAVYLKKSTSLDIDINDGALEIVEHNLSEKIFYKNFEKHAHESVYYSDFDPVINLDAQTLIPTGSSYKKMKVSTIETKDIVQPGIFYGGYKRKDFVYPMLMNGAIGRLEYAKKITDVHLLSPFYFNEDIKVMSAQFSVTFPRSVILKYKLFGENNSKVTFKEVSHANDITYTWTLADVPPFDIEKNAPSRPYTSPHIILYVDSYELKGNKKRVLSDVSDLYRWYDGLVKLIPSHDQTQLKHLVTNLTKQASSDSEKIRMVFQWVQQNIKYVAFENGMAGFVPRSAADVYAKRYGDCKDMANLIKEMLMMCGIEAYHTWIGTRSKPYTYQDVPTAIADNHMICSVRTSEGFIFLDATNPFLSYGNPSSMIQGKEALIGLGTDKYQVVKVPVVNRNNNLRVDSLTVELDKAGLKGTFSSWLSGYKKDDFEITQLKAELHNDKKNIRDFFTIGNNNLAIEKLGISGLGNQNLPASIHFDFAQPGYYKSVGNKMYVNLNLNKSLPGEKIDAEVRKQSVEQDYCFEDRTVTVFTIPDGYTLANLPENISKAWPEFGITSTYRLENNTIIVETILYMDYLYLSKDKFPLWNEFLQQLTSIYQQSVTLTKSI